MKELFEIQQALKAPKEMRNNFGNYNYRSCEQILAKVKPLLEKQHCTLTFSDTINAFGNCIFVTTTATLYNEAGEKIEVTASAMHDMTKKGMDSAQITGAASSYARKYALNGMFAIDDTKDPDTNEYKMAKDAAQQQFNHQCSELIKMVNACTSLDELGQLFNGYKYYTNDQNVMKAFSDRKAKLHQGNFL